MKYDYLTLKNTPFSQDLPIDINEPIETILFTNFKCAELQEKLHNIRNKKLFKNIRFVDGLGRGECEINSVRGIIPEIKLTLNSVPKNGGILKDTTPIHNTNLEFSSDKNKYPKKKENN